MKIKLTNIQVDEKLYKKFKKKVKDQHYQLLAKTAEVLEEAMRCYLYGLEYKVKDEDNN